MRLYDIAKVVRSKNAGPFTLTLDLLFEREEDFDRVLRAAAFAPENLAALYRVDKDKVSVHPFRRVLAIKVSMPRTISSGAPGDRDVYGSQQHFPLGDLEV